MTKVYQYDFDLDRGWVPPAPDRAVIDSRLRTVIPEAEITWDLGGGGRPPSIAVAFDLAERWALEGLSLVVQALNAAFIYVDGYPNQTCAPTSIGGMHSPAIAIGTVDCVGFSALA